LVVEAAAQGLLPPHDPLFDEPLNFSPKEQEFIDLGKEKAQHERAKRLNQELDYSIKIGKFVPRDAVAQASATAMAAFVQTMRSVSDNLERRNGVDAHTCSLVDEAINVALDTLADEFQKLCEKHYAVSKRG
jgi:hypothetical protein